MSIGKMALKEAKNRGVIKLLARGLEVSPQTIQRWKKAARTQELPKLGRPRISTSKRDELKKRVAEEMERQGNPGWRPIAKALPDASVRLVQQYVAAIKRERRVAERKRLAARRESTEVLAREAIWAIDGTFLERKNGKAIEAQVIKDRGSLSYRVIRTGEASDAMGVIRAMEAAKNLPLVLSSDNGSIYCDQRTQKWMRDHKIVHLRSLPRTPEHNGSAEAGIREAKAICYDPAALIKSACLLNNNRLRASKGYKTSTVLDAELPVAYDKVDRAEFYEKCMTRLSTVGEQPISKRERRMNEREVIYATLEEYGLIKRTGGGA